MFGVISQNCEAPQGPVSDGIFFQNACAAVGLDPLCCVAPVANQGILCQHPVGSS
ncbi:uncharacterized protein TrAtP1_002642 [Trichoderma atroviride]|uniref:uncharacterized protein n=1 Tax=Hypocrea atroviridis TaxID=63577 RepID=UPI00332D58C5|nr:hypothetical protein TrAtP1_002642 [Trichoderma atroviride]